MLVHVLFSRANLRGVIENIRHSDAFMCNLVDRAFM